MTFLNHTFNTLPPKPEHIVKVMKAIMGAEFLGEKDLVAKTGLTKTQMLCALNSLLVSGKVMKDVKTKMFSIVK